MTVCRDCCCASENLQLGELESHFRHHKKTSGKAVLSPELISRSAEGRTRSGCARDKCNKSLTGESTFAQAATSFALSLSLNLRRRTINYTSCFLQANCKPPSLPDKFELQLQLQRSPACRPYNSEGRGRPSCGPTIPWGAELAPSPLFPGATKGQTRRPDTWQLGRVRFHPAREPDRDVDVVQLH